MVRTPPDDGLKRVFGEGVYIRMESKPFNQTELDELLVATQAYFSSELSTKAAARAMLLGVLERLRNRHGEHYALLKIEADVAEDDNIRIALYRRAATFAMSYGHPTLGIRLPLAQVLLENLRPHEALTELCGCESELQKGTESERDSWSKLLEQARGCYVNQLGGSHDPRLMPSYFFSGAIKIDYSSAIRADIDMQNYTVFPRHWYVDATFHCARCRNEFVFSAPEQRFWYEELGFWIDSTAKHCSRCRGDLRRLKALQREYDREIKQTIPRAVDPARKRRLLQVIEELTQAGIHLHSRTMANRQLLARQLGIEVN